MAGAFGVGRVGGLLDRKLDIHVRNHNSVVVEYIFGIVVHENLRREGLFGRIVGGGLF